MHLPLMTQTTAAALLASPARVPGGGAMPRAQQLASLGAVLCFHRSTAADTLEGWSQAVRATCETRLDSDGLCESLQFFDREDRCCWRLYLLPDTDFLAWEQLAAGLPVQPPAVPACGIGERLWRRMTQYLGGPGWRAGILRFHALASSVDSGRVVLATSLPALSDCGAEVARRFVQREGVLALP